MQQRVERDGHRSSIKTTPYWWEDVPRPAPTTGALPKSVDVAVIGSGYTGLSAARETAEAGRSTLVIDAEDLGFGCSSRNGGQISTSLKPTFDDLRGRYNEDIAFRIRREGIEGLAFLKDLIKTRGIDCDLRVTGRFHGAHAEKYFKDLVDAAKSQPKGLEVAMEIVPRREQRQEIASDRYHGGVIFPAHGHLHPAKLHQGLMKLAEEAGARFASHCPVQAIERSGQGFLLRTPRGDVAARDVLIATNGYSGPLSPWHRRRVIPIGSYILATEPLEGGAGRYIPKDRAVSDSKRIVVYFRQSPDGQRILFGGRARLSEKDPVVALPALHSLMTDIYPELSGIRVTHTWVGFVAYTFDTLPHMGKHEGLWYCMGYCGSGVNLATYFGTRIGQQMLGRSEGKTALDGLAFPTRPLYGGTPWFLAPSVGVYRVLDRMGV
ncbi:MAG: FAD-binding oxidoreductase [Hyphomicrobiaceae bacterium]